MFEFTDNFRTGIKFMDEEHEKLFELANETYYILKDQFISDKYDDIVYVLNELRDYAKYHFKHEEEFMEEITYKRRFNHLVAHENFIKKLDDYDFVNIDMNQQEILMDMVEFLVDWLEKHIAGVDMEIAKSLNEK